MSQSSRAYLPATGHDWSLPLYDPLVRLLGGDAARSKLLDQTTLRAGHRVLDVGCGTGTFATLIKTLHPDVEVTGIDPDPKALVRARRKAERANVDIRFDRGFADELPYEEASFDRVVSSFVFHHLPSEQKEKALRAIRLVLVPGGSLHLVDFEGAEDGNDGFFARLLHASPRLHDNAPSQVLELLRRAGFANPTKVDRSRMLVGRVAYYRAVK